MVTLEIYIFQSSVKMTTQSKPLPFVTEQTTQIYICKELNNYTTKAKLYSLYKIVLQHVGNTSFFLSFVNHRKEGTPKKSI